VLGGRPLALGAARARRASPGAVSVCMTGGHGEWFVQGFGADGLPEGNHASRAPAEAARCAGHRVVAGNQAEARVALRGAGEALAMLPDARRFPLLPEPLVTASLAPLYGRPPDARLPA